MRNEVRDRLASGYLDAALEEVVGEHAPPDLCEVLFERRPVGRRPTSGRAVTAAAVLTGIAVVFAIAWLARDNGITAQDPDSRRGGGAYLPLAVGSRWEYDVDDGRTPETRRVTQEVTTALNAHEREVYQLRIRDVGLVEFRYVATDARGIHRVEPWSFGASPGVDRKLPPVLVLPAPVGAVHEWRWARKSPDYLPQHLFGDSTGGRTAQCSAELVRIGEALTVPAGRFDCVHVRAAIEDSEGDQWVEHTYYARGVGIVQRTVEVDGSEIARQRLVRYQPGVSAAERTEVLDAFLAGDARARELGRPKSIRWLDRARQPRMLQSEFALVTFDTAESVVRVTPRADTAQWFDVGEAASYDALLAAEGSSELEGSMYTANLAQALATVTAHVSAALAGEVAFEGLVNRKTSSLAADGSHRCALEYGARSKDGALRPRESAVTLRRGRVLKVEPPK